MEEQSVLVLGPNFGIFSTVCEMVDVPEDSETKVFRFKDGCKWRTGPNPVKHINAYSHWSEWDVGDCLGRYRVTRKLETQPGYIAAFEGTTRPKVPVIVPAVDPEVERCKGAILTGIADESPIPVRDLRRKTHADRFRDGLWDDCLKQLAQASEIKLEDRVGIGGQPRAWALSPSR